MLLFDALVGNNDRHFYNWGIVRHLKGAHHPYFAPIYDTARGLFWNGYEKKVISLYRNLNEKEISKYINNSKPKVGWEGNENLNHFQLVKFFVDKSNVEDKKEFANLLNDKKFGRCLELIEKEFSQLVSKERMKVIIFCLRQRYSDLLELFN